MSLAGEQQLQQGGFRIVVVGEAGVGRTALIAALATSSVPDALPPVLARPVLFPPSRSSLSLSAPSHVVDSPPLRIVPSTPSDGSSSSSSSTDPPLPPDVAARVRSAHAIVLVCDASRPETWANAEAVWLPALRRARADARLPPAPVVVAANKADLAEESCGGGGGGQSCSAELAEWFRGVLERNRDVESCTACSARQALYVADVFDLAQRAVLFPMGPLYDAATGRMTDACVAALARVFRLLDRDGDGALDDAELDRFQRLSMGQLSQQQMQMQTLTSEQLEAIRAKIRKEQPDGVDGAGRVTFAGFVYLNHRLCQRARAESTWRLLYAYGYGTNLRLRDAFLSPSLDPLPPACVHELGPGGIGFFADTFQRHDVDGDGVLSESELEAVFATTEGSRPPWLLQREGAAAAECPMTLGNWLASWRMLCLEDVRAVLRFLAMMGFDGDTREALVVARGPAIPGSPAARALAADHTAAAGPPVVEQRTTWMCYVFGSRGCGTSELLRALAGKPFSRGPYAPTTADEVSCGYVELDQVLPQQQQQNQPRTRQPQQPHLLVARVFASGDDDAVHDAERMARCDVCLIAHDSHNPTSFAHALRIHEFILSRYSWLPCVHAATKCDLPAVRQIARRNPDAFLRSIGLPPVIAVSARDGRFGNLFKSLVSAAMDPHSWVPARGWSNEMIRCCAVVSTASLRSWQRAAIVGASLAIAVSGSATLAFIVRRWRRLRPIKFVVPAWMSWIKRFFPDETA